MIGNGVWDTKYPKQYRKGVFHKPRRPSEKAWVEKRSRWEGRIRFKHQQSFLDYVRYMRWYTIDSRSYLYLKIHPRYPTKDGWSDATFGTWRASIP